MNDLQIFTNKEFGQVRTCLKEKDPWFVGKDVAEALGYTNSRKAIIDHVDEEDKGVTKRDTLGGPQEMTIINESGLYSLIFSSKLPSAKRFKRWVTSEVLPAIRKTGGYNAVSNEERLKAAEMIANAPKDRLEYVLDVLDPIIAKKRNQGTNELLHIIDELTRDPEAVLRIMDQYYIIDKDIFREKLARTNHSYRDALKQLDELDILRKQNVRQRTIVVKVESDKNIRAIGINSNRLERYGINQ